MKKIRGKVIEVFIPEQYSKDGVLLDVMDRSKIGFKVSTEDGIEAIVLEQDELNAQIMRDDEVVIIKQEIDGKKLVDIFLGDDEF